jgi:hypothetical protein
MSERPVAGSERARDYRSMTPEDFVLAIKKVAFDSAVTDTIQKLRTGPPSRGSYPRGGALSLWYNQLDPDDQQMVLETIRSCLPACLLAVVGTAE